MHLLLVAILLILSAPAWSGEVRLDGPIVQGGLVFGHAPGASRVLLDEESLMLSGDGHFVFGFGRDETRPKNLSIEFDSGERWSRSLQPYGREFNIERVDGLDQNHVTPPPEVYQRIREDAALTRRARERRDERTDWLAGWVWPARGRISGVYGSQRILNGEPRNPHWGLDIAAPTGTPVVAPAPGLITLAEEDLYFSGGTLFIDHGHGLVSAFLHLDQVLVEVGQSVAQGQEIGRIGATGRATGPHLDWRINIGNTRVDPQLLLESAP
jgi:murein DD-endopeptidase MepM/ murein hydrolase activator NlpD